MNSLADHNVARLWAMNGINGKRHFRGIVAPNINCILVLVICVLSEI